MKKALVVFACILFSFVGWAAEEIQGTYDIPAISSTERQPISQVLENLTAYEKSNAIINIECAEEDMAQAYTIEETWNRGDYEEAIELLKNSDQLEDAALGIQWKEPVKTPSIRWAGDVRVGTVDDIVDLDLDVDNSNGNLFAVLFYEFDATFYRYTVNMSADTGKTWTTTYNWITSIDHEIDIDCAVYNGYLYLAYTYVNNSQGRIRRFSTSDGSADMTFGIGGESIVIDEGVDLREIVLISNADHPSPEYLFYFSIMENDSIRCFYSNSSVTNWYPFNPDVGNADRGLDACIAVPNKLWASYVGTDDEVYCIEGWSSWTTYAFHETSISSTSIAAYGDTVMVVYTILNLPNYNVRYRISSNGGDSWGAGNILYNSEMYSLVNDVTARGGDGFAAVYQTGGLYATGVYRHRSYSTAIWTTPDSFVDNVTRETIKPCIERVAEGIYGIMYVNWPEEAAWFDRSDWLKAADALSLSPDGETIEFGDTLELIAYLEKDGLGVKEEELNFDVITGGGSLDPTSGITDGSGEVYTEFIAGNTAETVTVEVIWVSENLVDTLSATVDIEVVAGGIAEGPAVSGISVAFGSGEILCAVAEEGEFTVKVYDKLGREAGTLLNRKVERGYYPLSLKTLKLASDIYFVEMIGPGIDTKIKATLIN